MVLNKKFLVLLLALGFLPLISWAGESCKPLLPKPSRGLQLGQAVTGNFLSFLNTLYSEGIIGEAELAQLAQQSEKFANPLSKERAFSNSIYKIHYNAVQGFVEGGQVDLNVVRAWALDQLKSHTVVKKEKVAKASETAMIEYPIEFFPIQGGEFFMRQPDYYGKIVLAERIKTRLDFNFEMSSTPITQHQWARLMKNNPSANRADIDISVVNRDGVPMQGNYPVENITWYEAIEFANKLSEEAGLKPAYIITSTNGTIPKVEINAPDGDIYRTEGYRLPTHAEMALVLGKFKESLKSRSTQVNLSLGNRDVKEEKPVVIDGHEFYDIYSNVGIWLQDFQNWYVSGEYNPRPKVRNEWNSDLRVVSGPLRPERKNQILTSGDTEYASLRESYIGLRLVRTLYPEYHRAYPQISWSELLRGRTPIKMKRVAKGKFGTQFAPNRFEITRDFELAEAPVTQAQWLEVMGMNPAEFKEGSNTVSVNIDGRSVLIQPDNVLEGMTWWSAMEFANRLSQSQGLTPYYDLSDISFDPNTRAEDGTLELLNKADFVSEYKKIKFRNRKPLFSFKPFKFGYRLPSFAEMEYVSFHQKPKKLEHLDGKWVGYSEPLGTYGSFESLGQSFVINAYWEYTIDAFINFNSYVGRTKNPSKAPAKPIDTAWRGPGIGGLYIDSLRLARDVD